MMALTPVMAGRGGIPLAAGPGRAALRDMDNLPLVPIAAWCSFRCSVWREAGRLDIDKTTMRWRLTAAIMGVQT